VLLPLALGVATGIVALWPGDAPSTEAIVPGGVQAAEVTRLSPEDCEDIAGPGCRRVEVVLRDGSQAGETSFLVLPGGPCSPKLASGDRIQVARNATPPAAPGLDAPPVPPLTFVDFDRGAPLLWLAIAFAVLVVMLARWQGARSLVGLGISLVVVIAWLLPAILAGRPPRASALVGGLAVMLVTTGSCTGWGSRALPPCSGPPRRWS